MQLGPVVLMRSSSFERLLNTQTVLTEENSRLSSELGAGTTVHSFMHYPWKATTAQQLILQPDKDSASVNEAVSRVIAAYQRCSKERVLASPSMWDTIERRSKEFVEALNSGNAQEVKRWLTSLFQSGIIWGLGKFDKVLLEDMQRVSERSHVQLRITDALVSLAQATGAYSVTSVEQSGVEANLNALSVNLEQLLADIERACGFAISFPRVGGAYGCQINGKFVTIDSALHSYTVHRLAQLGANQESRVVEIGGGFGCLAQLCFGAGISQYSIYDLPWVNAIQGYYLLMSLPPEKVRLYGESQGTLEVNPFWKFDSLPDKSVSYTVNTDSLPEMGRQTAVNYIKEVSRVLSGVFLSINQEAKANNAGVGQQNSVAEIAKEVGGLKTLARSLYWMRQGYVEEVFAPKGA